MNDGTGFNPSDPNSMLDQGGTRNSVYNIKFAGVPDVRNTAYSKALNVHNQGLQNHTFYSFGAQHTNIKNNLKYGKESNKSSAVLNKKFKDVSMRTLDPSTKINTIVKDPNAVMNDYTKNIS